MPRPKLWKATPWGRIIWALQIVFASFQELEANERRQVSEIARRAYRDRRLDPRDREKLFAIARKAGRGGLRGVRGGGFRRR